MNPHSEHELSVGERVAVGGLPGGGMPLGDVVALNRRRVRVRLCDERLGVVDVERDRLDPIDWRCSQTILLRQQGEWELRVDKWHSYWLWRMRGHLEIVRSVALDECTADLARLAVERVPWVECPCTIGDADLLAQPDVKEANDGTT